MEPEVPRTIAIATCRDYPDLIEDDRPLVPALAAAGVRAEAVPWDAAADWTRFEAVLVLRVWDYFRRVPEFTAWLARLERERVRCLNPIPLLRWNMDKRYLRELAARGIPTVPTLWFERGDALSPDAVAERVRRTAWPDVILKPTISGGSWRTLHVAAGEVGSHADYLREVLADSGLMAQPFLPEVVEQGEYAFLFFGGEYSHTALKRPKPGDFRVQWTHGGSQVAWTPSPATIEQARAVVAAAP